MTTTRRLPADRDRAVARLRSLTLGAAAGGLLGTALFGAVAGATYDGSTPIVSAAATDDAIAQTTTDDSTTTTDDATTSLQATPAPTTTTSGAHASTGGS